MKKSAPGRVAPAPPACRGELALMRGRGHLWLLAKACYSCRTQEDEGDLGDLGPSDLPVRLTLTLTLSLTLTLTLTLTLILTRCACSVPRARAMRSS